MNKELLDFNKYNLNEDDIIIIGVSGGPDSMFLLDQSLKYFKPRNIVVAHINHNIRAQSKKDLKFVESFCTDNNLMFESMIIDEYSDDNFHNEARNIRYHFFETLIDKYNAKCLMTAHHADDLIETILMRLVRGSTLKGYAGFSEISYYNDMKIIRPMISITKDEILKYNKSNRVKSVVDKSNQSNKYTRNRYRKSVLPFLKKEDKNVHLKFLKYSELINENNDYLEKLVESTKSKVYKDNVLDLKQFTKQDGVIRRRIIFDILEDYYQDDLVLINDNHVNLINDLIVSETQNTEIYLPNNLKAIKRYDKLYFDLLIGEIINYEIEIIEEVVLPNNKKIRKIKSTDITDNNVCRINSEEISLPLYVRTRKHGDKIALLNKKGHSKIKNIFIDNKINLEDRDMWPIVCDSNDNIVWIPGLKKSKYCKQKNQNYDIILKYD